MRWKHPVKKHIGLETGVIALIIEVMTGRVTTGHGLSIERATIATEIEDLVVLSIEAIIIGMTVMVGLSIEAIRITVMGAAAHSFGSMVMSTITMVIQITTEVEVTHQADINEDSVTNVTIITIEVDSHGIR